MMKKLIFATHNPNKLAEIKSAVNSFEVVGLKEMGLHDDITETGSTLEENALIKSQYIFHKTGLDCFADDTGLEVKALNGRPGVYSARYAGPNCSAVDNMYTSYFSDNLLKASIAPGIGCILEKMPGILSYIPSYSNAS